MAEADRENCIKGASGKVTVDDKEIKDSWKEYMEKLMNEENEWYHKISAEDQQIASGWPKWEQYLRR